MRARTLGTNLGISHRVDDEFIAEKRQFGSSAWWQQMDREGRGGRR